MEFKWIPVYQDKEIVLPSDGSKVLISVIYGDNGKLLTDVYPSSYDPLKKEWDSCDCGEVVVAWANLPAPYTDIELNSIIRLNNLVF